MVQVPQLPCYVVYMVKTCHTFKADLITYYINCELRNSSAYCIKVSWYLHSLPTKIDKSEIRTEQRHKTVAYAFHSGTLYTRVTNITFSTPAINSIIL